MNIITNADVKKFVTLLKAGLQHGKQKELKNYTSASTYEGTGVAKDYYVSIEFSCHIDREIIDAVFAEDDFDLTNQINDLLKGL